MDPENEQFIVETVETSLPAPFSGKVEVFIYWGASVEMMRKW